MPDWFLIAVLIMIFIVGVVVVVELFILTALLIEVKRLAGDMRENVSPVIDKVSMLVEMVTSTMQTVQSSTEHIATTTAHTSDIVTNRVERTSDLVQQVVAAPFIGGMSLAHGIVDGVRAWQSQRRRRSHHHPPSTASAAGEDRTPPES